MIGWYGKLPSQGDFVSRRLPAEFIEPWDAWLQCGLAAVRAEFGEEPWLARYLVAPIRRFWLAPGLLGAAGWVGLLMPSVDRVGRHFPLTIAMALPDSAADPGMAVIGLAAALASPQWLAGIDQAARRVLDVQFTVEQFESGLAAIAPLSLEAADDEAAMQLACELWAAPQQRVIAGGTASPAGADGAGSIWWCEDAGEASQFLRFDALPLPEAFAALMSDAALPADSHSMP